RGVRRVLVVLCFFFFFQAEDGIRDFHVTGVQTCALPISGGYVAIGDTTQQRRTRSARSPRRYTTLPCTVEAPPGPDVVPTLLTWATVRRLYGSWTALITASPTWADLLETVGSEEDVVVL